VATFTVKNEREADISEALALLRVWKPLWKPRFFITDKCEAEINVVENFFKSNLMKATRLISKIVLRSKTKILNIQLNKKI